MPYEVHFHCVLISMVSMLASILLDACVFSPARYPDELAWQLDMDRKFIRQCETLKRLHNFLVEETESVSLTINI